MFSPAMTRPTATYRRGLLLGFGAIVLLSMAASGLVPGLSGAVAYLAPALLLLVALAARRYPGERALLAFIERRHDARRLDDSHERARLCGSRVLLPRGGRLIATSLAVRPPPARLTVALT
jgi:hypothetical protein